MKMLTIPMDNVTELLVQAGQTILIPEVDPIGWTGNWQT
jgi:hypothetical protein